MQVMLTLELIVYSFTALFIGYIVGHMVAPKRSYRGQVRIASAGIGSILVGVGIFSILSLILPYRPESILICIVASIIGAAYALLVHWQQYFKPPHTHIVLDSLEDEDEHFDEEIDRVMGVKRQD